MYGNSNRQALKVAEALATTVDDVDSHRELFQHIALRDAAERRALIAGTARPARIARIVHAIGELPAAQGPALMRDYVLDTRGRRDKAALREVWLYVAELGSTVTTRPVPPSELTDSAVVDAVGDLVDSLKQAVDSVVDAVVNAVGSIGAALDAAVDFTANQFANLAKALLQAGRRSPTSSQARSPRPSRTRLPSSRR